VALKGDKLFNALVKGGVNFAKASFRGMDKSQITAGELLDSANHESYNIGKTTSFNLRNFISNLTVDEEPNNDAGNDSGLKEEGTANEDAITKKRKSPENERKEHDNNEPTEEHDLPETVTKWKKVHIGVYVGKIFHESKRREKILNLVDEMELTGEILLDMKDTDFTEAGLAIGEAKLLIKRIGDDFKPKKKLGTQRLQPCNQSVLPNFRGLASNHKSYIRTLWNSKFGDRIVNDADVTAFIADANLASYIKHHKLNFDLVAYAKKRGNNANTKQSEPAPSVISKKLKHKIENDANDDDDDDDDEDDEDDEDDDDNDDNDTHNLSQNSGMASKKIPFVPEPKPAPVSKKLPSAHFNDSSSKGKLSSVPNSSAGAFNNSPRDYSSSNGRALPGFPALPVIDLDKTTSSSASLSLTTTPAKWNKGPLINSPTTTPVTKPAKSPKGTPTLFEMNQVVTDFYLNIMGETFSTRTTEKMSFFCSVLGLNANKLSSKPLENIPMLFDAIKEYKD